MGFTNLLSLTQGFGDVMVGPVLIPRNPEKTLFGRIFGTSGWDTPGLVGRGPRSDLGFPRTDARSISGRSFAIRYAIGVATLLSQEANVIVFGRCMSVILDAEINCDRMAKHRKEGYLDRDRRC